VNRLGDRQGDDIEADYRGQVLFQAARCGSVKRECLRQTGIGMGEVIARVGPPDTAFFTLASCKESASDPSGANYPPSAAIAAFAWSIRD
jgi:hypothetical protein